MIYPKVAILVPKGHVQCNIALKEAYKPPITVGCVGK